MIINHAMPEPKNMKPIVLPDSINYIAIFLTLECNLNCSYCINRFGDFAPAQGQLSGAEWALALNRIAPRADLPVTLQGGEPTQHPDFNFIINNVRKDLHLDVLTNLKFEVAKFMQEVAPNRIKRAAPYASIRVSYHPEVMQLAPLMEKVLLLQHAGYSIGVWAVKHPKYEQQVQLAAKQCKIYGIDFRIKDFLGKYDGRIYGTYRYPDACSRQERRKVICRTSELIVGPNGGVYRCHADLYSGKPPIANILDPDFEIDAGFHKCDDYGYCNPCDVKTKTDRFQIYGHTAVKIRPLRNGGLPAGNR